MFTYIHFELVRMSDDASREATNSSQGSEEQTFEINVKTLENQVHKIRVTKDVISLSLFSCVCCVCQICVLQTR